MKPLKKTWLSFFNRSLSLLLALLGFGSCDNSGLVMYGMPPAKYDIKANVLDENDRSIKGVQADISTMEDSRFEFTIKMKSKE